MLSNSPNIVDVGRHYDNLEPVQLMCLNVACAWEHKPQETSTEVVSGAIPQDGTADSLLGFFGRNTGVLDHILDRTIGTKLHLPNGKMRGLL